MRKITLGLLLLLVLVVMVGCAKPPQEKIQAATQSIEQAQQAGASDYAPESLKAAEDSKTALDAELKAQDEKFALFRSYKHAEELADQTKAKGEQAANDAKTRKEQVKAEAQTLINDSKTALTEAKDKLAKAPKGKGTAADLKALDADLAGAESALTEAESAMNAERFLDAKAKAEAVKSKIGDVNNQIQAAIDAKAAAKKGAKKAK